MQNDIDIEAVLSQADPRLGRIIRAVVPQLGILRVTPSKASAFEAIVRAVIYQQMQEGAAAAIHKRLLSTVQGKFTPRHVLHLSAADIHHAGLSSKKTEYVQNIAKWFDDNPKVAQQLHTMTNQEIADTLTTIKGVGLWTVNVFLIFNLARLDVIPVSDFGIRKGIQLMYGLEKPATPAEVKSAARLWTPYESIASMYLWQAGKLKLSVDDLQRTR